MANPDLQSRILEARAALEGDERQKRRDEESARLGTRQAEARRAMEDPARRLAREAAEKAEQRAREEALAAREKTKAEQEAETRAAKEKEAAALGAAKAREEKISAAQQTVETLKTGVVNLNPVRTLRSDLNSAVQDEKISLSRIALQTEEKKRLEQNEKRSHHRKTTFVLVLILLLLLGGAGAYFYTIYQTGGLGGTTPTPFTPVPLIESLIFAEKHEKIDISALSGREIKKLIANHLALPGSSQIIDLYFTNGGNRPSFSNWQEKLELDLPQEVLSSLAPEFMLGITGNNASSSSAFLILKSKEYERSFAAMLAWERRLPRDLGELLGWQNSSLGNADQRFTDQLFRNVDTRVLQTASSTEKIMYAFLLDRELIAITNSEATLGEIITRFRNISR